MTNIYQAYQQCADATDPLRASVRAAIPFLGHGWSGFPTSLSVRKMFPACEIVACTQLTHVRPPFAIDSVEDGGRTVAVREEVVDRTLFCRLLRLRKDTDSEQPAMLLVAPMSGHFATLLRGTVKTLLRDHDVYVTDWRNARDIALEHGGFGLDEYVVHLIRFLQTTGPGAHIVALRQRTVAAITAVAVMAGRSRRPAA